MFNFSKATEPDVVNGKVGYPYNALFEGYPRKLKTRDIEKNIDKLVNHLLGNAGVETIVNKDASLINLGLSEISNRENRRWSRVSISIAIFSLIFSGISLVISVLR